MMKRIHGLALFGLAATFAPAGLSAGGTAGAVAEIVTFRIRPGVSDDDFLRAAKATGPLVAAQPGFLRRSLSKDEGGVWTDYVEWSSLPQALAAAEAVMAAPEFGPFVAAIEPTGMTMRHAPVLWAFGG